MILTNPTRRHVDRDALRAGLETLGTVAAAEAQRLPPERAIETSMCTARPLRWSWKFRTCRRQEWRTIGGTHLMTQFPTEPYLEAAGWQTGSRHVVVMGPTIESPTQCVVFESDPDATTPDPVAFDDLNTLAESADENYRAALRRHGIGPHG